MDSIDIDDDQRCCDWCGDWYLMSEHQIDTDNTEAQSYCPECMSKEAERN